MLPRWREKAEWSRSFLHSSWGLAGNFERSACWTTSWFRNINSDHHLILNNRLITNRYKICKSLRVTFQQSIFTRVERSITGTEISGQEDMGKVAELMKRGKTETDWSSRKPTDRISVQRQTPEVIRELAAYNIYCAVHCKKHKLRTTFLTKL